MISFVSSITAPAIITAAALIMIFSKKVSSDDFLSGVGGGIKTCASLLPTLIMLVVCVSMLSASGFTEIMTKLLGNVAERLGIPSGMLPLILTRPFSGSASSAMLADIFEKYGADSITGRTASVLLGSSETAIYVISVYYGAVGVKKTRFAIPAALATMVFCVFFSSFICNILFGN